MYVASDKGYTFGTETNTTFFVRKKQRVLEICAISGPRLQLHDSNYDHGLLRTVSSDQLGALLRHLRRLLHRPAGRRRAAVDDQGPHRGLSKEPKTNR